MTTYRIIEQILDSARWAPSGDNTQPWRFEIVDEYHAVVHGFDTRDHCVYDLDGHPSQIAIGTLLETMSIAASGHGLQMRFQRRLGNPDAKPTFDIYFAADSHIQADPLIPYIPHRSVQRRPMRTRPLTVEEKKLLDASVGSIYCILWLEGFSTKLRTARLMFNNAKLRLTMPEAYQVHRSIIQWNARYSEDRVPDQALGADPMTVRMMRFVMQSWERVEFFNTFLAATWAPRIQMDFIPSLACAAHFVIKAQKTPSSIDDYIAAGRALQRFWLTLTQLGLVMQPELTPVIFSSYVRKGMQFSKAEKSQELARELEKQINQVIGADADHAVFMGRVGAGSNAKARSTRLPLQKLMMSGE